MKFIPNKGHLVPAEAPGTPIIVGQFRSYCGYRLQGTKYIQKDTPFEVSEDSPLGRRLIKLTKRDLSLIPFDKETAEICRVNFKAFKFSPSQKEWIEDKEESVKEDSKPYRTVKKSKQS